MCIFGYKKKQMNQKINSIEKNISHKRYFIIDAFRARVSIRSTQNLKAMRQTRFIELGFFWLDFFPLVRDIFIFKYEGLDVKDFEILMQLHSIQPFSHKDVDFLIRTHDPVRVRPPKFVYSMGHMHRRTFNPKMNFYIELGILEKYKLTMNEGSGRKFNAYVFTKQANEDMKALYKQMVCSQKIDIGTVPEKVAEEKRHFRKILRQNAMCDAFKEEEDRLMETTYKNVHPMKDYRPPSFREVDKSIIDKFWSEPPKITF